jgi:hypothetical protein
MNTNFIVLTQTEWENLAKGIFKQLTPLVTDDFDIQVGKDPATGDPFVALPVGPLKTLLKLGARKGIRASTAEERQFYAMVLQTPDEASESAK